MTVKEKKSKIADIIMDAIEEYNINEINRPMIPSIYAGKILDSMQEEPVSEDLEKASKEWLIPQLDKSYANYGEVKMMELTHFDGYAMLDAIEFGAKWQLERVNEALLSEVLPCFMHGGEADEVVAKLDEVLNQKK